MSMRGPMLGLFARAREISIDLFSARRVYGMTGERSSLRNIASDPLNTSPRNRALCLSALYLIFERIPSPHTPLQATILRPVASRPFTKT